MTKTQSLFFRSASGAAEEEEEEEEVSHVSCGAPESDWASPVGVRMSESGNSSKFDVSSMLLISMGMAAGLSLRERKRKKKVSFEPC